MMSRWFAGTVTAVAVAGFLSMVTGCQNGHRPNETINDFLSQNEADLSAGRFELVEATSLKILAIDLQEPQALFQLGISRLCRGNVNGALDVWSTIDEAPPGATVSDSAQRAVLEARRLVTAFDAQKTVDQVGLCRFPQPLAAAANPATATAATTKPTPPAGVTSAPSTIGTEGGGTGALHHIIFERFLDEASFDNGRRKNRLNREEQLRDFLKSKNVPAEDPMLSTGRIKPGGPDGGTFVIASSIVIPIELCSTFVSKHCPEGGCGCLAKSELGSVTPLRP